MTIRLSRFAFVCVLVQFAGLYSTSFVLAEEKLTVLRTPSGREIGLLGEKPRRPAPTLFVFATSHSVSLQSDDFNKAGKVLSRDGVLCGSLDIPCHGVDHREGEPDGLAGWRYRLDRGENVIDKFCQEAKAALDYLIEVKYTDPQRVGACGTSRGGFIALHFAAAEPRVKCVAAFAPVTDLLVLNEFKGMSPDGLGPALGLTHFADPLSTRPVWIIIGPHDERVGTDSAIAVARKITASAVARKASSQVDLHVQPSEGHRIPANSHDDAAAWLKRHLQPAAP